MKELYIFVCAKFYFQTKYRNHNTRLSFDSSVINSKLRETEGLCGQQLFVMNWLLSGIAAQLV